VQLHESDYLLSEVGQLGARLKPVCFLAIESIAKLFFLILLLCSELLLPFCQAGHELVEVVTPHSVEALDEVFLLLAHLHCLDKRVDTCLSCLRAMTLSFISCCF
jgi:hypothetical protein